MDEPKEEPTPGDVTLLLQRLNHGDGMAYDELLSLVYRELHTIADRYMKRERPNHTLQATALTHEALIRLSGGHQVEWKDRAHFLGVAARAMRQVLVDHARGKRRIKRGGDMEHLPLEEARDAAISPDMDLVELDEALKRLAEEDERKAKVVELLYFGGLTAAEAGEVLGVTSRTVERDWRFARAWLLDAMSE